MKRLLIITLTIALAACSAVAPRWFNPPAPAAAPAGAAAKALPAITLKTTRFTLANGLSVIVHEDPQASVTALDLWYHVGSKDQAGEQGGFAALFQQVLTASIPDASVEPAAAGGSLYDRVHVATTLPSTSLDYGLWSFASRMRDPLAGVDATRFHALCESLRTRWQAAAQVPFGTLPALIAHGSYPPGHPYAQTPDDDALAAATLPAFRDWVKHYDGAANATLVISGRVDPATVQARIDHYFADLPAGPPVSHLASWPARMSGERRVTAEAVADHARLVMAWNLPPAFDPDTVRLRLVAALLADGDNSLLARKLVTPADGGASAVHARVDAREVGSQFVITVDVRPGASLDALEQGVDEVLAKLLAEGPGSDDIQRVRNTVYTNLIRTLQAPAGEAAWIAAGNVFAGRADAVHDVVDIVRGASADEVRDSLRNWLTDGVFVLDGMPIAADRAGSDSTVAPPPESPSPGGVPRPPLQHARLANGLTLALAPQPGAPLMAFDLILGGGRSADTGLPAGTTTAVMAMLGAGTRDHAAPEFDAALQSLGASFQAEAGADVSAVHMTVLKQRAAAGLDLLAEAVREPLFPAAALAAWQQQQVAVPTTSAPSEALLTRLLPGIVLGAGHPYASQSDAAPAVGRNDLMAYAQRWLRPDNATLVVVGDIDMSALKPLVAEAFADWHADAVPLTRADVPVPATTSKIVVVDQPAAAESWVVAAAIVPPPSSHDAAALPVLLSALRARVSSDLIDDHHWSHQVVSGALPYRALQLVYAGAVVDPDHAADALVEIRRQIDSLGRPATRLSDEETRQAKRDVILGATEVATTPEAMARAYQRDIALGVPVNADTARRQRIEAFLPSELQAAAQKYLSPDALTWIVIGDRQRVEPLLQNIHAAPVSAIDSHGEALPPLGMSVTPAAAPASASSAPPAGG